MNSKNEETYEAPKERAGRPPRDDYRSPPEKGEGDSVHGLRLNDLEDGGRVTVQECVRHIRMLKHSIDRLEKERDGLADRIASLIDNLHDTDTDLRLAQQANSFLRDTIEDMHSQRIFWNLLQIFGASLLGFVPFIYQEIPDTVTSRSTIAWVVVLIAVAVVVLPFTITIKKRKTP